MATDPELQALRDQVDLKAAASTRLADRQLAKATASMDPPPGSRKTSNVHVTRFSAPAGAARPSGETTEEDLRAAQRQLQLCDAQMTTLQEEAERLSKQLTQATLRFDKEVAQHRDTQAQLKVAESRITLLKKELAAAHRQPVKGPAGAALSGSEDGRLARALQDLERTRQQLAEAQKQASENAASSAASQRITALEADVRMLEAQRSEFVNCIRKQNRLIDVLKRQKFHLEAAKLLQITEQDFSKVLEGDEDA